MSKPWSIGMDQAKKVGPERARKSPMLKPIYEASARGKAKAAQAPATGGGQHSGLYDPKTTSNFEEEIKKRRKNPTGGAGGYGGSTLLG
jgi:hypothetical protein